VFLLRPFPELVNQRDRGFIRNYVRTSVIEPVILRDIPKEFGSVDILLLEKLATVFLSDPGQYVRIDELSKELRRAKTTLYKALFYLEFSFLIKRVLNYRPSVGATSRKLAKVYAYHPGLAIPFEVHRKLGDVRARRRPLLEGKR
jgi:predicted AAA+ superfamily ATPase